MSDKESQPMTLIAKVSFWFFKFEIELKPSEPSTVTAIENVFGTTEQVKARLNSHEKEIRLGA